MGRFPFAPVALQAARFFLLGSHPAVAPLRGLAWVCLTFLPGLQNVLEPVRRWRGLYTPHVGRGSTCNGSLDLPVTECS